MGYTFSNFLGTHAPRFNMHVSFLSFVNLYLVTNTVLSKNKDSSLFVRVFCLASSLFVMLIINTRIAIAVFRGRVCNSCPVERAGPSEYGRDLAPDPRNLCDHVDRLSCFSRISVFCRILFKRHDFGSGVCSAYKCRFAGLLVGVWGCLAYRFL